MTSFAKLGAVAVSLVLLTCAARGSLVTDPNGMNGGTPGQWQNTVQFKSSPLAVVAVDVEYCVYAPGMFGLSFPGADPTGGTEYVYAYQVFNTLDPHPYPATKGAVTRFSVGLSGGNEQAGNISYVVDDPNHTAPTGQQIGLVTAGWDFASPNDLKYGYVSDILFYTSPFAPEMDAASVSGTMSLTASGQLPSPTPEPATLGLLGTGLFVLVHRRVRRK